MNFDPSISDDLASPFNGFASTSFDIPEPFGNPQPPQFPMSSIGGGGFTFDFTPEPGFDDGYMGDMMQANFAPAIQNSAFTPAFESKMTDNLIPNPGFHDTHFPTFYPPPTHGHRKSLTGPVSRPVVSKSKPDVKFQVRKNRKIPTNQPTSFPPEPGSEDEMFQNLCNDKNFKINPVQLEFIPTKFWPNENIAFGDIVADFFQRKNNVNCRFSHKLFNAIQISKYIPNLKQFVGVEWVSSTILKVSKIQFARLLGIRSIDGSLFHQQGNFSTHGFFEVSGDEARSQLGEAEFNSMDLENVRLLKHSQGIFVREATEEDLEKCKWVSSKKKAIPE
jgi:hypothetical protein